MRDMKDAASIPLLVLLPGLDGTGKLFAHFVRMLGEDIDTQVIAYPTDQPLGYEELEHRVRASLPADRPFVLLGESFGGPIAMRIAASSPVGMRGLILCGTFAKNPYPLFGWASRFAWLVPVKSLPRWLRAPLMWGSKDADRAPPQAERAIAGVAAAVVRRRIAALLTVDASDCLELIRVPALILYARRDRVVPFAATRWLTARMPGAEIAPIEGPHLLLQARPHECAPRVVQFIRNNWSP
ncbi:MAG: alpha/beta hydrolase [Steroidobacteraceae bacterium]|jgi:pimeloyl-ACP methyl ester carboxylesterase